jgi:hypothetical protein
MLSVIYAEYHIQVIYVECRLSRVSYTILLCWVSFKQRAIYNPFEILSVIMLCSTHKQFMLSFIYKPFKMLNAIMLNFVMLGLAAQFDNHSSFFSYIILYWPLAVSIAPLGNRKAFFLFKPKAAICLNHLELSCFANLQHGQYDV